MAIRDIRLNGPCTPRWLHGWAIFTVCATFVGLLAGSLVTTLRVGMADPVWPTAPWFLLVFDGKEPRPGFIIEHSHRALMYLVGICAIVLAVGLWRQEPRRWVRWLGYTVLLGVIAQGMLGGFRVLLDRYLGTDLAFTHGCFAQLVFALMVAVASVTSRGWTEGYLTNTDPAAVRRLRRSTCLVVTLVYLQIVFGAVLRHSFSPLGPRGHFMVAFAVVAAVVWLTKEVWERHRQDRILVVPTTILAALVAIQVMMGVEAWLIRFVAADPARQIAVRTVHVLLGSLILASAVVVTLQAQRSAGLASGVASARREAEEPVGCLEEVA